MNDLELRSRRVHDVEPDVDGVVVFVEVRFVLDGDGAFEAHFLGGRSPGISVSGHPYAECLLVIIDGRLTGLGVEAAHGWGKTGDRHGDFQECAPFRHLVADIARAEVSEHLPTKPWAAVDDTIRTRTPNTSHCQPANHRKQESKSRLHGASPTCTTTLAKAAGGALSKEPVAGGATEPTVDELSNTT